jgi:hypothetical protein
MRSYIALGWRSEMVKVKFIAAVLLILVAARSGVREHPHRNGEKLVTVHFTTSSNDVAQKEFNRVIALTPIPLLSPPGLGRFVRNLRASVRG